VFGTQKQSVSAEMHIFYATCGHGFGIRDMQERVSTWDQRLLEWMKDQKILQIRSKPGTLSQV
jgi:hypothetical protein